MFLPFFKKLRDQDHNNKIDYPSVFSEDQVKLNIITGFLRGGRGGARRGGISR